jgi:TPP-dependent indolepyruvate ferredoxin oxidoreductase alpha subunit
VKDVSKVKYKVVVPPDVKKKIRSLPKRVRISAEKAISRLSENPQIGKLIIAPEKMPGIFKKHFPKYCPECGEKINSAVLCVDTIRDEGCYDCYCGKCKWCGEICPNGLSFLSEHFKYLDKR